MTAKNFYYLMIASVVLGLAGIFGAYYWGNQQLEAKADEISNLQTDRDIVREKIIALSKAQQSTENSEEAELLLDKLLPTTKQQDLLVADVIYTASAEAGVPINNISSITFSNSTDPSDTSGTEAFKEVSGVFAYPFNMTVQNISFETLIKLLQEIETNGRLVQVDNIQINPSKSVPGEISSITLSMKAFLKP